jgi:hypothetical protein
MAMPHDLNQLPAYDHLKGTPKKAHEGSQSQGHSNNTTRYSVGMSSPGSKRGAQPESKGPGGMDM